MAELKDVIAYFCQHYPFTKELSKARLTKMVYLADWRSAVTRGSQVTGIVWQFNHFGPYVDDVVELARHDPAFRIDKGQTMYGDEKELVQLVAPLPVASLTNEDRAILDFVIDSTKNKYWDAFIRLVYSTYPIVSQPRFATLDLVALAKRYLAEKRLASG